MQARWKAEHIIRSKLVPNGLLTQQTMEATPGIENGEKLPSESITLAYCVFGRKESSF